MREGEKEMSWTPTFIVEKEEFDKHFQKLESILQTHSSGLYDYHSNKEFRIKQEKKRLEKNVTELGLSISDRELEEKARESAEKSKENEEDAKKLEKTQHPLGDILNNHSEDEFTKVGKEKYYMFDTEYSSQANALKDFLEENKIPFGTSY